MDSNLNARKKFSSRRLKAAASVLAFTVFGASPSLFAARVGAAPERSIGAGIYRLDESRSIELPEQNECKILAPATDELVCVASIGEPVRFKVSGPGSGGQSPQVRFWSESPDIIVTTSGFTLTPYTGWGTLDPDPSTPTVVGPAFIAVNGDRGEQVIKVWLRYRDNLLK